MCVPLTYHITIITNDGDIAGGVGGNQDRNVLIGIKNVSSHIALFRHQVSLERLCLPATMVFVATAIYCVRPVGGR